MDRDTYRFQIGAIACTVIKDGSELLTEALVGSIFVEDSERMVIEWKKLPLPESFSRNILVLETEGRRVLIDAGEGATSEETPGRLLERMRAEGIDPGSIDTVILTHCHIDHFGGLINEKGERSFPNARIVMSRAEYAYWTQESVISTLKGERGPRLKKTFALYPVEFAEDGDEVEPGIKLVAAPGHTPGHLAVLIESQGERLLHIVDAFHMTIQLRVPDAIPRFDNQPKVAVQTRIALMDRAEKEQLLVMTYHLAFPGLGTISRTPRDHRKWTPHRDRQDVPDSLLETYDMLACAYPDGISEADYWSVMALVHPLLGSKAFPQIVAALTNKTHSQVYADTLRLGSERMPEEADVTRVQQKLDACGYQEWVKKVIT